MMYPNIVWTVGSATLCAVAGAPDGIITGWDKLGIIGFLTLGIIALYRDSLSRQKRFEDIMERAVAAMQKMTDVAENKCSKGATK